MLDAEAGLLRMQLDEVAITAHQTELEVQQAQVANADCMQLLEQL